MARQLLGTAEGILGQLSGALKWTFEAYHQRDAGEGSPCLLEGKGQLSGAVTWASEAYHPRDAVEGSPCLLEGKE